MDAAAPGMLEKPASLVEVKRPREEGPKYGRRVSKRQKGKGGEGVGRSGGQRLAGSTKKDTASSK